jgi:hypothetical protein
MAPPFAVSCILRARGASAASSRDTRGPPCSLFCEGRHHLTVRLTSWRGLLPRAGLLAVIIALVPLPVAANDGGTDAKTPTIKASMERIVARDLAAAPASSAAVRPARQGRAPGDSPAFFKSGPGIVALVMMVAGTGYALYSSKHDRITSAGKK